MSDEIYSCQSTNLTKATVPLNMLDIRRYLWDITSGTHGSFERIEELLFSLRHQVLKILGARERDMQAKGKCRKTPVLALDLRPGELVEVKSKEEITQTLDVNGKNRGLVLNSEMLEYCQRKYRVLRRVDQMINEKTGRMRKISNTVILEGVTCNGKAHGGCQRSCYCLWREIWLRRVGGADSHKEVSSE